jgi:hypothetical protein
MYGFSNVLIPILWGMAVHEMLRCVCDYCKLQETVVMISGRRCLPLGWRSIDVNDGGHIFHLDLCPSCCERPLSEILAYPSPQAADRSATEREAEPLDVDSESAFPTSAPGRPSDASSEPAGSERDPRLS